VASVTLRWHLEAVVMKEKPPKVPEPSLAVQMWDVWVKHELSTEAPPQEALWSLATIY